MPLILDFQSFTQSVPLILGTGTSGNTLKGKFPSPFNSTECFSDTETKSVLKSLSISPLWRVKWAKSGERRTSERRTLPLILEANAGFWANLFANRNAYVKTSKQILLQPDSNQISPGFSFLSDLGLKSWYHAVFHHPVFSGTFPEVEPWQLLTLAVSKTVGQVLVGSVLELHEVFFMIRQRLSVWGTQSTHVTNC